MIDANQKEFCQKFYLSKNKMKQTRCAHCDKFMGLNIGFGHFNNGGEHRKTKDGKWVCGEVCKRDYNMALALTGGVTQTVPDVQIDKKATAREEERVRREDQKREIEQEKEEIAKLKENGQTFLAFNKEMPMLSGCLFFVIFPAALFMIGKNFMLAIIPMGIWLILYLKSYFKKVAK